MVHLFVHHLPFNPLLNNNNNLKAMLYRKLTVLQQICMMQILPENSSHCRLRNYGREVRWVPENPCTVQR